ncbi:hypothetical protein [Streptomyces sp. UH6]|uniref:hypothetical protein n=1 Tax=Streptomyces sp. UH6 TaxID=2748379 RepID=UPI0015D4A17A|nr:hypothetical protein [Streptomyces sp. UH6]NYV73155.1 hypothetical protein [Streptomyces sp. UH6]
MTDPVNRTIFLLDIERFSDRDDVEQAYLRRMLYDVTDRALAAAGIDENQRLRQDAGDSVMELIDANASVTALLRSLLTEVPARLRAVNRMASSSAQIRLRCVLATGYVAVDKHGWVGSDLNHACRLLDAPLLRAALRERSSDFVLCVSENLYAGVVRHGHHGIVTEDFHRITVDSKNGPLRAWLHGPVPAAAPAQSVAPTPQTASPHPAAPETAAAEVPTTLAAPAGPGATQAAPPSSAEPEAPAQTGPVFNFNGVVTFGGGVAGGDQHGVSGGHVTGDVVMGGRHVGREDQ